MFGLRLMLVILLWAVVKLWGNTGEWRSPSVFGGGMPFP